MDGGRVAKDLAWFGIGLGVVELLAPRAVARTVGLERHASLIPLFGSREIAAGAVVLAAYVRRPRA